MCGIWAYITNATHNNAGQPQDTYPHASRITDFLALQPRGPDHSRYEICDRLTLGFHRLAIMNPTVKGNQPFAYQDARRTFRFVCNGEIYNAAELAEQYLDPSATPANDCEVLAEILWTRFVSEDLLYRIPEFLGREVKGEFALMGFLFDAEQHLTEWFVSRDPIGVRPLYRSRKGNDSGRKGNDSAFYTDSNAAHTDSNADSNTTPYLFTSELKGARQFPYPMEEFPPGTTIRYFANGSETVVPAGKWVYETTPSYTGENDDGFYLQAIQDTVIASVQTRLHADRPMVALLSGGVDSSLVCALAQRLQREQRDQTSGQPSEPLVTICCGMPAGEYTVNGGAPFLVGEGSDLGYARKVAAHIGSTHHEVLFTPQQGIDAIPDVIQTIESWDTTTVRASVGQYMASKWIAENLDAKVVLVGEGPDEVCSSYLFNEFAPSGTALHETALEYVDRIHMYDGRRLDRCIARWGLEARVPLLDTAFIEAYWTVPAVDRMPVAKGIEKWWLRKAFGDKAFCWQASPLLRGSAASATLLPDEVLWRKKSAFSDSMTDPKSNKSWYQILADWAETQVTDEELANAATVYPYCTPTTKEAYLYRKIFCERVGAHRQDVLPGYWQPKWNANGKLVEAYMDPSALVLKK